VENPFSPYVKALSHAHAEDQFIKYKTQFDRHRRIIVLGNEGSNSVASHISQDYMKFHQKKVSVFSDPSMITMMANDYGYENAYKKFLEYHVEKDTLVVLISSSGESLNILNCMHYCQECQINYGILTGFNPFNTLRRKADLARFDYHVDSESYGVVECVHQIFLHGVV